MVESNCCYSEIGIVPPQCFSHCKFGGMIIEEDYSDFI